MYSGPYKAFRGLADLGLTKQLFLVTGDKGLQNLNLYFIPTYMFKLFWGLLGLKKSFVLDRKHEL